MLPFNQAFPNRAGGFAFLAAPAGLPISPTTIRRTLARTTNAYRIQSMPTGSAGVGVPKADAFNALPRAVRQ
jgi:hypothetical protein